MDYKTKRTNYKNNKCISNVNHVAKSYGLRNQRKRLSNVIKNYD